MLHIDLDLLRFCRDAECNRVELHKAHGVRARAISIASMCECGRHESKCKLCKLRGQTVVDMVYKHVGMWSVTPFNEILDGVLNDYGSVVSRTVHRAVRTLLDGRKIVSIPSIESPRKMLRGEKTSGWYIRYDSPKLWTPRGLRDLMSVVAEAGPYFVP